MQSHRLKRGTARLVCHAEEGAGAASRRRLQQQLDDKGQPGGADAPSEPHDWDDGADAVLLADAATIRASAATGAPAAPPANGGAQDAPRLAPQGWADDAPPSVTASVAIMPRQAAALVAGGQAKRNPVTLFFAKCKLAWSLFFPSPPETQQPPASSGDVGRQRLSMILVADRAGLSPGSLMQMKQSTVRALAQTMDMRELADAQLRFTMPSPSSTSR
ncbi:hypothetical protein MNEG_15288 [Monoraphidium neglectum]|uniref:Uncharacterized protein n=1 Tax=Monoraphidium neglectum TaxID=145388 RepID=A0A0D2LSB3_9CHLO|nr:hypothetical protein MNEG_15288 [Monoraphidium neglectum]KIY92676.1 hypothetical protein MNEG_15288 [Monoraphidium neglectum]|eukprot:XP_013891696.1 hypothetical protein MNEG_15288 [Monoraphidium neglectum]